MTDHQSDSRRDVADVRAAKALAASRRSEIASFIVMDVMRAAAAREAAGHRIVHMEVGQPGTPAPRGAREALVRALDRNPLGYTQALGMPELRARIARHYRDTYAVDVPAGRIVVTAGSSAAFVLAFLALFDAGDRVALPQPGYPCYRHILSALGCRPVLLDTGPATRWMPTPEQIAAVPEPLAGLLVASPANPTGTMLEPERLRGLIDACRARGMWFIADEIYHGLSYGAPATTALAVSDDVVVINSFSKYFSMTGWRVGWMVVPEPLVRPIEKLAQNLYIAPPTASQVAALGAFDSLDELEANRRVYADNRALLLAGLPTVGFAEIVPADGAFYLYCDVSRLTTDSEAFARQMLDETGIAATPGVDFDAVRGGRFIRFSYSGRTPDMADALERLSR
ncbi:MAG: aminotransferase class I/II-fold pyridoxal phosphate-dependent enzyme, partial [Hyphomicrobium sp.]